MLGSPVFAGDTQIGEFLLDETFSPALTFHEEFDGDTNTDFQTRTPASLPVGVPAITSQLTGLSQNANMELVTTTADATDLGVRTGPVWTKINHLNRYDVTPSDLPGAARIGVIQYKFDLSPLEGYLSGNSLNLDALDMDFLITPKGNGWTAGQKIDLVMSYTSAAESIALADIDRTITDNWSTGGAPQNHANLWHPVNGVAAAFAVGDVDTDGDVDQADLAAIQANYGTGTTLATGDVDGSGKVNGLDVLIWQRNLGASPPPPLPVLANGDNYGGSYYVLQRDVVGVKDQQETISRDLLTLYAEGVREFNVMIMAGDYMPGRSFNIDTGSGISITTSPAALSASTAAVPEPTSLALAAISLIGLLQSRRQ
jgi:hypothetical protein